jgi:hypothetical protein
MKRVIRRIFPVVAAAMTAIVLSLVVAAVGFIVSHRTSVTASPRSAESEFAELRTRFAGQQPLLDMGARRVSEPSREPQTATALRSFHSVIFDTRGGQRVVRIAVPYWFARLYADRRGDFRWLGQLTFLDDTEFDPEAIRLSLDQLERHGPGLIVDYRHPTGGQFIAWVE